MKLKSFAYLVCLVIIPVWSCSNVENKKDAKAAENRILQQNDGSISLLLDKAACYNDAVTPANNTADWNVVISKPGRFKVWLTSATKDTSDLRFMKSLRISMLDNQLEGSPATHEIVRDQSNPSYYRADSYMGSVYVSDPGEYNIQVISEMVTAKNINTQMADTKLLSVVLTPEMR
jgi:hypothetical protein